MENPTKMDDFGGYPYFNLFQETTIWRFPEIGVPPNIIDQVSVIDIYNVLGYHDMG